MACECCVLVVDDDPCLRQALAEALEALGCKAELAADGREALERLDHLPRPCLVLLDLNMPRLDGASFARIVRQDPRRRSLPIVTMSADRRRLAHPGVDTHLEKPFSFEELAPTVSRFCPRRSALGAGALRRPHPAAPGRSC